MADSTPAVQAELSAALGALNPQITGLQGLAATGLSPVTVAALDNELATQTARRTLIQSAQAALTALQADGYPNTPLVSVSSSVLLELQEKEDAMAAAIAIFTEVTAVTADLSRVTHDTQPRPTKE